MELILISSNKLKVTLDGIDREKYRLDEICRDTDICESDNMKKLLEDIRHMSGFDTQKDGLVVEIFGPCNGSFEIFITQTKSREIARSSNQYHTEKESRVYIFESLKDLVSACRALSRSEMIWESSAYADGDRYYMSILIPESAKDIYRERLIMLLEFGTRVMNTYACSYLYEHATVICKDNAIAEISKI